MPQIIPALLCPSLNDLREQIKETESLFPYIQIDIGDGLFTPYKTPFNADELATIQTNQKYELHLMVENPIAEARRWKTTPNVFRAIFHLESSCDPTSAAAAIRACGYEVGIALNPDTPLTLAEAFYDLADVVLFMTVIPGKQGQQFMPEVGEKIAEFTQLEIRPTCAVDGGINKNNIAKVAAWGGELLCVGSALLKGEGSVEEAYRDLKSRLERNI